LIKSKRSTASDTNTKPSEGKPAPGSRWLRLKPNVARSLPEIDDLLDIYWGGPERRITGITARIFTVNLVALLCLLVGIVSLGQYQENLVKTKLGAFGTEVEIIAAALDDVTDNKTLQTDKVKSLVRSIGQNLPHRLRVFDHNGDLIADTDELLGMRTLEISPYAGRNSLFTVQVLKEMTDFIINLAPQKTRLQTYANTDAGHAMQHPDAMIAMRGQSSLSAWYDNNRHILLSAAQPVISDGEIVGAALLMRPAHDIKSDISDMWLNIIAVFALILFLTLLLSIYLSGFVARPLKKLARAAEGVRKGLTDISDIPDMSARNDEIGELSIALRAMTSALRERMDEIESFASDVSHELKNPLTSLKSAVETASVVKKAKDRDKLMDIIKHDIIRLDRLITDISHISRLDTELSREAFEAINLKALLHKLLNVYQDPLKREAALSDNTITEIDVQGVRLSMNFHADKGIYVYASEGRLMQVFENLLANAISFSPQGGTVSIRVVPSKSNVLIHIDDEGPGIPAGMEEKIFERFYSQRPDEEDYGQNSGLGLSICRQIVSALGGAIYADNIKNAGGKVIGARFTVLLKRV